MTAVSSRLEQLFRYGPLARGQRPGALRACRRRSAASSGRAAARSVPGPWRPPEAPSGRLEAGRREDRLADRHRIVVRDLVGESRTLRRHDHAAGVKVAVAQPVPRPQAPDQGSPRLRGRQYRPANADRQYADDLVASLPARRYRSLQHGPGLARCGRWILGCIESFPIQIEEDADRARAFDRFEAAPSAPRTGYRARLGRPG